MTFPAEPASPPIAESELPDDALRTTRLRLIRRVENGSKSDADFVCLSLSLIPREEILQHANPKKTLLKQVLRVTTPEELADIEYAINHIRR